MALVFSPVHRASPAKRVIGPPFTAGELRIRGFASPVHGGSLLRLIPWSAFAQTSPELTRIHEAALTVLADTGRLKPFIDQTEKQLQAAPRSRALYAQLREMLIKANDRPRLLRLYDAQTKQFPDDHLSRLRIGTNHAELGDLNGAIPDPAPRPRAGIVRGAVHLLPGQAGAGVPIVSPLAGDFEATWIMTAPYGGWPEVNFAGVGVALKPDRTGFELITRSIRREQPLMPPLETADGRLPGRLRARDGIVTIELGGRILKTEAVTPGIDPWLAFLSPAGPGGAIGDLRVTGSPAVPPAVEPAAAPDLDAWRSWRDLAISSTFGGWSKAGPEVRRRRGEMPRPIPVVGMLNYRRPVFEDGVISYQFRYESGPAAVHPAVGGIAFLLEPGSVTEYHAAAARFDDPKAARKEVAAFRRGPKELPLKPGDWNRVELALARSKLTLTLNDMLIYERPWAAAGGQCFGLSADPGEAPIRVRDVRWRGEWPRSVAELKLRP